MAGPTLLDLFGAPTPEELMADWINAQGPLNHHDIAIGGRRATHNGRDITLRWGAAINYEGVRRTVRMNIHYFDGGAIALGSMWMDGVHGVAIQVAHDMRVNLRNYLLDMARDINVDGVPLGNARF